MDPSIIPASHQLRRPRTAGTRPTSHHSTHERHAHAHPSSSVPSSAVAVAGRVHGTPVHPHRRGVLVRVVALLLEELLSPLEIDAVLLRFLQVQKRSVAAQPRAEREFVEG